MHHSSHNVQGLERKLSVAGGLGLLACGLRHGGVSGLLAVAAGGMALYRGMTGHCELKARLCSRYGSSDIARYAPRLGSDVTVTVVRNGLHDLSLSCPAVRDYFFRAIFRWLPAVPEETKCP